MCRSCSEGGRRCQRTNTTRVAEREASARYYKRGKARRRIAQLADQGIPAVGDEDLPAMYHQHDDDKPLTLDGPQRALANPGLATIDKPTGALWSAPGRTGADGLVRTAWTDRSASEGNQSTGTLSELRPKPGAVVVTLSTPEDAEALMGAYGTDDELGKRGFDWEAMKAEGIDGVSVTQSLVDQGTKFSYGDGLGESAAAANFETWDVGSTVWLSTVNLHVAEHHQPGQYEFKDDPEAEAYSVPDLQPDDGYGVYDEPDRPNMTGAWDRVPARFRPTGGDNDRAGSPQGGTPRGPAATPPAGTQDSQDDYDDAISQLRARLDDNPPAGQGGGAVGDDDLDVLNAVLKGVPARRGKKKRAGAPQGSR